MSRKLTGAALAEVLGKAAEVAIAGAVQNKAVQFQQALEDVDAGRSEPSLPEGGRVGEGAVAKGVGLSVPGPMLDVPTGPLPYPPPFGERGAATPRLAITGRAHSGRRSATLTLSAPNLFAREYGALNTPADPVLAPAIDAIRRRPA
ncbi:hypothetical protein C3941_08650 [Kaistia algarum]|uniref:hypothetical protein n=1 Tax=Kaistia algarum TaxID=2083279 RepID=UPI000CE7F112|nr:hypothetical protein [Kaistia algarum]MCX5512125.1 hypothetical protein [Kaistia algarum]PPE80235.1 hypothetical protein C3941_08650 [Kaistia algarum]